MNPQTIQSIVTINGQSQLGMSCPILVGIADKPSQSASIPSTNLVGTTTG
ncbi:MAG: hypothetical protein JWO48_1045, partial [Bryobacterales bacterium]|nr:hypothetical protein [Bryobacterales bacterium]